MQSDTSHQQVLIYHSKSTIMNYKCDVKLGSPRMARLINGKLQFEKMLSCILLCVIIYLKIVKPLMNFTLQVYHIKDLQL
jgi:hypothetical protein